MRAAYLAISQIELISFIHPERVRHRMFVSILFCRPRKKEVEEIKNRSFHYLWKDFGKHRRMSFASYSYTVKINIDKSDIDAVK